MTQLLSEKSIGNIIDEDFIQVWVTSSTCPGRNRTVIFGRANWLDDETIGVVTSYGCVSMLVKNILSVTKTDGVYDILHDGLFLNLSPKFTDDKQSS